MVNANYQQDINRGLALERMMSFIQRFGKSHFHLACHAAFPIALTPDLLYRIWTCFTPNAPWVAVSDVLLSSLCQEVGYELYEMNLDVRSLLLEELKEDFGQQRLDELSDFLIQYSAEKFSFDDLDKNSLDEQSLALAQEWTVLSYKKFDEISNRLKTLQQNLNEGTLEEFVRLISLTQALPQSILESAELLIFANGVARWIRRDAVNAVNWFNQLPRINGSIDIGGAEFSLPLKSRIVPESEKVDELSELDDLDSSGDTDIDGGSKTTHTRAKIRYGQIMDQLTAKVLEIAEISFYPDWQYSSIDIKLDFLFPNRENPAKFMEVTQTKTDNALSRKLLRYFELVAEAKIFFGSDFVAITLIYGRPDLELSTTSFKSSVSFFDASFVPRVDDTLNEDEKEEISKLEAQALELAKEAVPRNQAVEQIVQNQSSAISALVRYFRIKLPQAQAKPLLAQLWTLEGERTRLIVPPENLKPIQTSYKKGILQSLFLTNAQFSSLRSIWNPNEENMSSSNSLRLSTDLVAQMKKLNLIKITPTVGSDDISLSNELNEVLENQKIIRMVELARQALSKQVKTRYFFEDIYDVRRRERMVQNYFEVAQSGRQAIENAIYENLISDEYAGIKHSRCWIADLVSLHLKTSQNILDNMMKAYLPREKKGTGKPFRDICMKFERILGNSENLRLYAEVASQVWQENIPQEPFEPGILSNSLLQARLTGAMYLQNFNPLHIVLENLLKEEQWTCKYKSFPSVVGDLVNSKLAGRFELYVAQKREKKIYLIIISAYYNSPDKSKEWAARGRALHYRIQKEEVAQIDFDIPMIFVCDGIWDAKSRYRLERVGWRTCALDKLPDLLYELESQ